MTSELAATVALLGLVGMGPARAGWLLAAATPRQVVTDLRAGRLPPAVGHAPSGVSAEMVSGWGDALRRLDVDRCLEPYHQAGIEVLSCNHRLWPLADDPEPPVVLFGHGRLGLAARAAPSVAIVGTRRCTAIGRRVAFEFGAALAEAGVVVVSGLATGIDGSAHRGVLAAGGDAIGVVATGLDTVYPRANRDLWCDVAERGLLLTEGVLGTKGDRWRFPARNRIIAGLADVVVVVESHERGGSLLTVDEAITRDRQVLVVPGAVTSPASAGSNRLLVEGATPVCSADDVLALLSPGLLSPGQGSTRPSEPVPASPLGQAILDELSAGAVHVDQLVTAANRSITEVLAEVDRLERGGWVSMHGSTVARIESHGGGDQGYYAH